MSTTEYESERPRATPDFPWPNNPSTAIYGSETEQERTERIERPDRNQPEQPEQDDQPDDNDTHPDEIAPDTDPDESEDDNA